MSFDVQGPAPQPSVLASPALTGPSPCGSARVYGWLAIAGIAAALVIMIIVSLARASWMGPPMAMPRVGPPFELTSWRLPLDTVTLMLWGAAIAGGLGVTAGLVAVQRGWRPPVWPLLAAAAVVIAILTVLPPVGSTDAQDYMAFGRIMVLGHSPYVWVPWDLLHMHDVVARSIPWEWGKDPTPYGPAATVEQFLAARLGGTSAARIVFWLKLGNALAFGAVAVVADSLLRSDPAARLRAHLLWTINPLLIWQLIASAHLDVLAAAAGLLGLVIAGGWPALRAGDRPAGWPTARPRSPLAGYPGVGRAFAGGLLIGIAADIKITFLLFALGLVWALRRSVGPCVAAGCGVLAVILPSYAWFGPPAITSVLQKGNKVTADNFYQLISDNQHGFLMIHIGVIATILVVSLAILTTTRLPFRPAAQPAIFAALALSTAWLFVWQYQLPSYDAMIICLLIVVPASWLDWLVMARLTAGTVALMPGNPTPIRGHLLSRIQLFDITVTVPLVLAAAVGCLIGFCLSERRSSRRPSQLEREPDLTRWP